MKYIVMSLFMTVSIVLLSSCCTDGMGCGSTVSYASTCSSCAPVVRTTCTTCNNTCNTCGSNASYTYGGWY